MSDLFAEAVVPEPDRCTRCHKAGGTVKMSSTFQYENEDVTTTFACAGCNFAVGQLNDALAALLRMFAKAQAPAHQVIRTAGIYVQEWLRHTFPEYEG